MNKIVLLIEVALLLLCLLDMPYGFYMLVRFVSMCIFGYMAYTYAQQKNDKLMYTFGVFALLFQPFFKISLGRGLWNVVDVVVAIFLVLLLFQNKRKS